jgi:hypothetical protein
MKERNSPLKADIIGASQRLRDTLALVFQGPVRGACVFASGTDADLVIVDIDSVGAYTTWDNYREKYPERPAIVLSVRGGDFENAAAVLTKPIKVQEFSRALQNIADSFNGLDE